MIKISGIGGSVPSPDQLRKGQFGYNKYDKKLFLNDGNDIVNILDGNEKLGTDEHPCVSAMDFRQGYAQLFGITPILVNQKSNGDRTTRSTDGGMSGNFVAKGLYNNGYLDLGDSYDNCLSDYTLEEDYSSGGSKCTFEDRGDHWDVTITGHDLNGKGWIKIGNTSLDYSGNTIYSCSLRVDRTDIDIAYFTFNHNEVRRRDEETGRIEQCGWCPHYIGSYIYLEILGSTVGEKFKLYKDLMISVGDKDYKPHVKETKPLGSLMLPGNWSISDYTFIFVDQDNTISMNDNQAHIYSTSNKFGRVNDDGESLLLGSPQDPTKVGKHHAIIGKNYSKALFFNGEEEDIVCYAQGKSEGVLNFSAEILTRRSKGFGGLYIFKGNLTEQESKLELSKILSNRFIFPDEGSIEPLPFAKRRTSSNGLIEERVDPITLTPGTYKNLEGSKVYLCDAFSGDIIIESLSAAVPYNEEIVFKKIDSSNNKVTLKNSKNGGFVESNRHSDLEITEQFDSVVYKNV